ncbi:hypothetical protein L3X38_035673 [Prunus dulcis]|uniref:Uncharacterized protein n=1 Tax=Prunus dulcis TaxID=3755 RepID=A0AAD4VLN0_PRUDU|nr:hypothetical protein L3X38_035673 [Prunus dulcis]
MLMCFTHLVGLENLQTAKKYYASVIDLTGAKNIRALFVLTLCTSAIVTACKRKEQGRQGELRATITGSNSLGERLQAESSRQTFPAYYCLKNLESFIITPLSLKNLPLATSSLTTWPSVRTRGFSKGKKGGKKKAADPFAKKDWYDIKAPSLFTERQYWQNPCLQELRALRLLLKDSSIECFEEDPAKSGVMCKEGTYSLTSGEWDFTTDKLRVVSEEVADTD